MVTLCWAGKTKKVQVRVFWHYQGGMLMHPPVSEWVARV